MTTNYDTYTTEYKLLRAHDNMLEEHKQTNAQNNRSFFGRNILGIKKKPNQHVIVYDLL